MLSYFVPISLVVTTEMVKVFQSYFISTDPELVSEDADIKPVIQSSNVIEDLGQIEYVFSDKTGTLTCNQMVFKNCALNGISYGDAFDATSSDFLDYQK